MVPTGERDKFATMNLDVTLASDKTPKRVVVEGFAADMQNFAFVLKGGYKIGGDVM